MAYEDDDIDMQTFLKEWGYKNVEEWALDSDYEYDDDIDVWFDEEGNAVNIEEKLYYAIEASLEG